ncbi:hypothetical protein UFOVP843_9 [uncultured Caudovirales phage]|uniref:Uncharacterized protein n=1 Tax=uncultured Caudovirales phage TaxID=2100421 RepID=A0A6J5P7T9_9CAUD|nr:hypothetical protein UFOVP843_9 [uncultured Caudovirales phage]CAB4172468.1 hypothetical protein UFOVP936_26 [uncultured Caudovirales phage]
MTTTYAVYNPNSDSEAETGLCLADAANKLMTYDGHDWEIREEDGAYHLYTSQFSRHSSLGGRDLVRSVVSSYAANRASAEAEIFERVISEDWWTLWCITDTEFAQQRAAAFADAADDE